MNVKPWCALTQTERNAAARAGYSRMSYPGAKWYWIVVNGKVVGVVDSTVDRPLAEFGR